MFKAWEALEAAATEKRRELETRGLALRAVVRVARVTAAAISVGVSVSPVSSLRERPESLRSRIGRSGESQASINSRQATQQLGGARRRQ